MAHNVQPLSSNRAESLKRFLEQSKGSFDLTALQWSDKVIIQGKSKGKFDQEAYITSVKAHPLLYTHDVHSVSNFVLNEQQECL